jgi:hypothetical protein
MICDQLFTVYNSLELISKILTQRPARPGEFTAAGGISRLS